MVSGVNLKTVPQKTLSTHSATKEKQGWVLNFRCSVINSNFISCINRWVLVTTARSIAWFGIEERRPDMKGSCECTEYVVADRRQGVVLQLCTWNMNNPYRAGSLTTVARGLVMFRLDLVCVQEVGWEKRDTVLAEDWNNEGGVHLARRRDRRVSYRVLVGGGEETDQLQDIGVEERIILILIFNMWDGVSCTGFVSLRIGTRWALANAVINLRDSKNSGEILD